MSQAEIGSIHTNERLVSYFAGTLRASGIEMTDE
jgi:hypothetical protein